MPFVNFVVQALFNLRALRALRGSSSFFLRVLRELRGPSFFLFFFASFPNFVVQALFNLRVLRALVVQSFSLFLVV